MIMLILFDIIPNLYAQSKPFLFFNYYSNAMVIMQ